MFTIDTHLDLATNAINLNRDLRLPAHVIREKERDLQWSDTPDRGNGTVSLPELRKGKIGLVVATIISRFAAKGNPLPSLNLPGWHSAEQAYACAQAQLGWYRVMEERGEMVQIRNWPQLQKHLALWIHSRQRPNHQRNRPRPRRPQGALGGARSIRQGNLPLDCARRSAASRPARARHIQRPPRKSARRGGRPGSSFCQVR